MPLISRHVTWSNETNYTGVVTDPLKRLTMFSYPQVYHKICEIARDIMDLMDSSNNYDYHLSSESSTLVPAMKSHRVPVKFLFNHDREAHPTLTVQYIPESESIPIRSDFLENHGRMNTIQNEMGSDYENNMINTFHHPLNNYAELITIYDALYSLIDEVSLFELDTPKFKVLQSIMLKYGFDWSDEKILLILNNGFLMKNWKISESVSRSDLMEILKFAKCLKCEFYKRRFGSVLQYR